MLPFLTIFWFAQIIAGLPYPDGKFLLDENTPPNSPDFTIPERNTRTTNRPGFTFPARPAPPRPPAPPSPPTPPSPSPPAPWVPPIPRMSYGPGGFFPVPGGIGKPKRGLEDEEKEDTNPLSSFIEEDGVPIYQQDALQGRTPDPTIMYEPQRIRGVENVTTIMVPVNQSAIWTPEVVQATLAMIPVVLAITIICVVLLFMLLCCYEPRSAHSQRRNRDRWIHTVEHENTTDAEHQQIDGPGDAIAEAIQTPLPLESMDSIPGAPPIIAPHTSREDVIDHLHPPEVIYEQPSQRSWLSRLLPRRGKSPVPETDVYMNFPVQRPFTPQHTSTLLREATSKLRTAPEIPSSLSNKPPPEPHSSGRDVSTTLRNRRATHRDRWLSNIFADRAPGTENLIVITKSDGTASGASMGGDIPPASLRAGKTALYDITSSSAAPESSNDHPLVENLHPGPVPAKLVVVSKRVVSEEGYNGSIESADETANPPTMGHRSVTFLPDVEVVDRSPTVSTEGGDSGTPTSEGSLCPGNGDGEMEDGSFDVEVAEEDLVSDEEEAGGVVFAGMVEMSDRHGTQELIDGGSEVDDELGGVNIEEGSEGDDEHGGVGIDVYDGDGEAEGEEDFEL